MKREMICINCPVGCRITASWAGDTQITQDSITVSGNRCPRGDVYGKEEILAPKRVVTATCAVCSEIISRVPVKTDGPILKAHIKKLLDTVYTLELTAPVTCGDVIMDNIEGSGINLCATRSIPS